MANMVLNKYFQQYITITPYKIIYNIYFVESSCTYFIFLAPLLSVSTVLYEYFHAAKAGLCGLRGFGNGGIAY